MDTGRNNFPPAFAELYSAELLEAVVEAATNASSSIHGPEHWARVAHNGFALADETAGADRDVIRLFALLHDAMRENDSHDPEHGARAADLALELLALLELSDDQYRLLVAACEQHDRGHVSLDPTIGCCWDSDRLDLPRVGTTLDLRYFSTAAGRNRVASILGNVRGFQRR